jgi:hypothetical protein
MDQWLQHCPPINRLAFTGSLLQPVDNHPAGYEILNRYMRWVEIDPQSSEFLYRINRRANSTAVQGLDLNRLSTWHGTLQSSRFWCRQWALAAQRWARI